MARNFALSSRGVRSFQGHREHAVIESPATLKSRSIHTSESVTGSFAVENSIIANRYHGHRSAHCSISSKTPNLDPDCWRRNEYRVSKRVSFRRSRLRYSIRSRHCAVIFSDHNTRVRLIAVS